MFLYFFSSRMLEYILSWVRKPFKKALSSLKLPECGCEGLKCALHNKTNHYDLSATLFNVHKRASPLHGQVLPSSLQHPGELISDCGSL
jgi:hypothetical protein